MEVKRFLEKLSSATPTPGGGSASALAGALSASLVTMVAGLTVKKGRADTKGMETIRKKGLSIQQRLFQAVEEDSRSFESVMKAFRLPKNSEKDRLRRAREIQNAYQKATVTPQLVCRHSLQLLEYCQILILKGNPNAISDAGVAAFLADAAFTGGLLNVQVNLASVTERTYAKKMNTLMQRWAKRRGQLMKAILKKLITTGHG
ncbi:MAG TPA: cyclodeaminase/cyclohydrolase family protein [Thermodesulfobacteriota bacterium]|nr:cyclodeaminase/cyclohydrolase family protein [Thermodesulfobacteriota bacterium]